MRIDGHRRFQLVFAPLADLLALVPQRKCEVPVIVGLQAFEAARLTPGGESERAIVRDARRIVADARALADSERALGSAIDRSKVETIAGGAAGMGAPPAVESFERLCRQIAAARRSGDGRAAQGAGRRQIFNGPTARFG